MKQSEKRAFKDQLYEQFVLMGVGMALLYPTRLAAVSDVAAPRWRATSLGVYRFWRDSGYAFGALAIGVIADAFGLLAGF